MAIVDFTNFGYRPKPPPERRVEGLSWPEFMVFVESHMTLTDHQRVWLDQLQEAGPPPVFSFTPVRADHSPRPHIEGRWLGDQWAVKLSMSTTLVRNSKIIPVTSRTSLVPLRPSRLGLRTHPMRPVVATGEVPFVEVNNGFDVIVARNGDLYSVYVDGDIMPVLEYRSAMPEPPEVTINPDVIAYAGPLYEYIACSADDPEDGITIDTIDALWQMHVETQVPG